MGKSNLKIASTPLWVSWLFICLGILFFAGAYYGITEGKWPYFMPPQIDIFSLFFISFGKPLAGYLVATFLAIIGIGSFWLGFASLSRHRNA
jgi:hypothetical protein